jgi:hypothetical protein
VGLLLLGVITGCSQEQACTAIGAPPTIGVDVSRILAERAGPVRVRLCVGSRCDTTWKSDGRRLDYVSVNDGTIDDAGPVRVDLMIETGSGERIYEVEQDVTLTFMQPNGPDCDPSKFAARLVATDRGGPDLSSA